MEAEKKKTFKIPVSNGILEHYGRIGNAVWLYLWFIDKTTREEDTTAGRVGVVLGGMPISDNDPAESLGCSQHVIRKYRRVLARGGYIEEKRTPYGHIIRVLKSKKWYSAGDRHERTDPERYKRTDVTSQSGTNVPRELQDRTDVIKTLQDITKVKVNGGPTVTLANAIWKKLEIATLPESFSDFVSLVEENQPREGESIGKWADRIILLCKDRVIYPKCFLAAKKTSERRNGDLPAIPLPPGTMQARIMEERRRRETL